MIGPFSVLMATYAGERPEWLEAALRSVVDQTLPPKEIVLVLDGPVGPEHDEVLRRTEDEVPLTLVRLPKRSGLAAALNAGIPACQSDWIARMDSDDISLPTRFQRQAELLAADPRLGLVAAWHAEFEDEAKTMPLRVKTTPAEHQVIARRLRWRNVLSHPTIVVRRSALAAVGGYRDARLLEDWDLYLRLLRSGVRFGAVQEPLVRVRTAAHAHRRGGLRHLASDLQFRRECLRRGDICFFEFAALTVAYSGWRLMPSSARTLLYPLARRRGNETA